jgi:Kef-type K+ transport system membrane component KefB
LLLLAAFIGKFVAGFCIRESRHAQTAIGLAMIPRGEVGLIFAALGFTQNILNGELYAALLIVVALTTMAPPFLLKWYYGKQ